MTYVLQAILACATTAILILWMRRPAERLGLIDRPGGRKRHDADTPITGGLAITISLFLALAPSFGAMSDYRVLLAAIAVLAFVGVLDDRREVFPRHKLGAQVLAAVLMTSWGGHYLVSLGNLFGQRPVDLFDWSIPLTVFATVAVINAINTFDGLDGLAGGVVLGMLGYFGFFAWTMGDANALKFLVVVIGALAGFMLFNAPVPWRGARTFMGDTGSQVLGVVVAWFSIGLTQGQTGLAPPPVTMLWVVGIVLFDFFTITVRRVIRKRNPALPDRAHIHHILLRRGLGTGQTVLALIAANLVMGAVGAAGWLLGWPERLMFGAFVVVGLAYFAVFVSPARFMRLTGRGRGRGMADRPVPNRASVALLRPKLHSVRRRAITQKTLQDDPLQPDLSAAARTAALQAHPAADRSLPPAA